MTKEYKALGFKTSTKYFERYFNAGLLNNIDEDYIQEVKSYWKTHYNKKIDPSLNQAFTNLTGKKEPRVIPARIMRREIMPYFNDWVISVGYRDKNIYDILIKTPNSAKNVLKCVRGSFFDSFNNSIDETAAKTKLLAHKSLIIKPSKSNNGVGITKLVIQTDKIYLNKKEVTMNDLIKIYNSNFIIQEMIKQHSIMAAPHPSSVNSLRMVTFRWKNKIQHLLTFARFGANNDVRDNAGSGGVCLGVRDSGEFLDLAIDEEARTYTHHPTTNFKFSELDRIPNFEQFKQFVIEAHKDIIHHDFISWDIAVGTDGLPIFIEANFAGATWLYQLAAQKPIFGDLTEEVLQHVAVNKKDRISVPPARKIKNKNKKIKKLEREIDKLKTNQHRLKQLVEAEKKKNKIEYDKLLNSKSIR